MPVHRVALVVSWAIVHSIGVLWLQGYGVPLLRIVPEAVMEWLVLRSIARVGPQWIAASIASRYGVIALYPAVASSLGSSPGGFTFIWVALSTLLAIPVAFVLSRYSRRGWLWLAAPAITTAVGRSVFALVGTGGYSQGRPSINMIAVQFALGLLEGCLLAYILRDQIAAPKYTPAPAPTTSTPEQVRHAYVLMPPIVLAAGMFVRFGMMDYPSQDQRIGNFAIAQALALGASIALLLISRTRAIGAAIAFASAVLAVGPVILLGGLLILLGGGATWQGLVLPVLAVLLIAIAFLAFRAIQSLPSPDRLEWPIGITVPVGLTAILMSIA